jgi:LysR family transcriptional activator of nhaA
MATINFKHLRYFWAVAKSGSIARASSQLHVTPQSISSQLAELEEALGTKLFRRVGRGLEMTDIARRIVSYAEEIFGLEDELLAVVRDQGSRTALPFRIGIADSVPKSLTYRVVEPALHLEEAVHLYCKGRTPCFPARRSFGAPARRDCRQSSGITGRVRCCGCGQRSFRPWSC